MTEASLHTFRGDKAGDMSEDDLSVRSVPVSKTKVKSSSKKSSSSRSTAKMTDLLCLEERLSGKLEEKVSSLDSKFDSLLKMLSERSAGKESGVSLESNTSGVCRPREETEGSNLGARRPLIDINNGLDESYGIRPVAVSENARPVVEDTISLQPGQNETREFLYDSDVENMSVSNKSVGEQDILTATRFDRYKVPGKSDMQGNSENSGLLFDMFGSDAQTKPMVANNGLALDHSQMEVLDNSLRCKDPSRLSAYKDSYKLSFPVSAEAEEYLKVPSLDELSELLLVKKHGRKAAFGASHSLYSQPNKAIEKIAYQGQVAAKMGVISLCYAQQALGQLLINLKDEKSNIDENIQMVRDVFAISTKALDQMGRAGAFHHLVRRKATVADTDLYEYKDLSNTALYSPLSGESMFGKDFEKRLKERQEKDRQLSDLMPELTKKAIKRKSSLSFEAGSKKPRYESNNSYSSYRQYRAPSQQATQRGGSYSNRGGRSNATKVSSFRSSFNKTNKQ